MCLVQWVLIGAWALWPLIALAGGLGYTPLITIAALLCLPGVATRLRPQLYMLAIAMLLEFVAYSERKRQVLAHSPVVLNEPRRLILAVLDLRVAPIKRELSRSGASFTGHCAPKLIQA